MARMDSNLELDLDLSVNVDLYSCPNNSRKLLTLLLLSISIGQSTSAKISTPAPDLLWKPVITWSRMPPAGPDELFKTVLRVTCITEVPQNAGFMTWVIRPYLQAPVPIYVLAVNQDSTAFEEDVQPGAVGIEQETEVVETTDSYIFESTLRLDLTQNLTYSLSVGCASYDARSDTNLTLFDGERRVITLIKSESQLNTGTERDLVMVVPLFFVTFILLFLNVVEVHRQKGFTNLLVLHKEVGSGDHVIDTKASLQNKSDRPLVARSLLSGSIVRMDALSLQSSERYLSGSIKDTTVRAPDDIYGGRSVQ